MSKLPVEPPAHGFLSGRSTVSNARLHVGRRAVLNMDLEGFFPSISFPRVRSVFERLGYSPAAASILALLCVEDPFLGGSELFVRGAQDACAAALLGDRELNIVNARRHFGMEGQPAQVRNG